MSESKSRYAEQGEIIHHNRLLFYTGIPGVGKDYLLSQLKLADHRIGTSYHLFPFGEMLQQQLRLAYGGQIESRDAIRHQFSQAEIIEQVGVTADRIIAQQPGIVNTHLIYPQQDSIVINPNIIRRLSPAMFVFVRAEAELIQQWRQETNRQRDQLSIAELDLMQGIALDVTTRFGQFLNSPVHIIENTLSNVQFNTQHLQELVSMLLY